MNSNPYYTLTKTAGLWDRATAALLRNLTRWYAPARTIQYPATEFGTITRALPTTIHWRNVAKDSSKVVLPLILGEEAVRRVIGNRMAKAELDAVAGNYGTAPEAEKLNEQFAEKQRLKSEENAQNFSEDTPEQAPEDKGILKDIFTRGSTYKGGLLGALAGYGIGDWIQPKRTEGRKILDMLIGTAGGAALGYGIDKFFDQPKQG